MCEHGEVFFFYCLSEGENIRDIIRIFVILWIVILIVLQSEHSTFHLNWFVFDKLFSRSVYKSDELS